MILHAQGACPYRSGGNGNSNKTSEQSTSSSSSSTEEEEKEQEEEVEKQTRSSQGQHKANTTRNFPRWEAPKAVSTSGDGVTA